MTERDEPQAVIGSYLHKVAYPTATRSTAPTAACCRRRSITAARRARRLRRRRGARSSSSAASTSTPPTAPGGFRVYDVANIDNKGFSRAHRHRAGLAARAAPLREDQVRDRGRLARRRWPWTRRGRSVPENQEQKIHPVYAFLYVTDREEGLIVIGNRSTAPTARACRPCSTATPTNNFLERALAFNPDGLLTGAVEHHDRRALRLRARPKGLVVVDLDNPLKPRIVTDRRRAAPDEQPRAVAVQFRYAFVTDADGLKVRRRDRSRQARGRCPNAVVPLANAHGALPGPHLRLRRGGRAGAGHRRRRAARDADARSASTTPAGRINDAHDVKVGMTNASLFAYVADGKNGLRVLQLTSPEETPTYLGFSPRPTAAADRDVPHSRAGAGHLQGHRPRSGRRRERQPDRRLQPARLHGRSPWRRCSACYLRDGRLYTVSEEPPAAPRSRRRPSVRSRRPSRRAPDRGRDGRVDPMRARPVATGGSLMSHRAVAGAPSSAPSSSLPRSSEGLG